MAAVTMRCRLSRPVDPETAYSILEKEGRRTLGSLATDATAADVIPASLVERVQRLVTERNWLIHSLVRESGDDLYTNAREEVFGRIRKLQEEAVALRSALHADLEEWCSANGVDVARAAELARTEVQRLRGE